VALPVGKGILPDGWRLLEENVLGEFGFEEVLKQFLGAERADRLSPAWVGDRYAVFEDAQTKNLSLVLYLALDNSEDAGRFFGQYSEALEMKYKTRQKLFRRPNFFEFQTDAAGNGAFLRCVATRCLVVEGATRATYDALNSAIGWTAAPAPPEDTDSAPVGHARATGASPRQGAARHAAISEISLPPFAVDRPTLQPNYTQ